MTWTTVAAVAMVCLILRVASPFFLATRRLPPTIEHLLDAAVIPILVTLVFFQLFIMRGQLHVDARAAGVAAGAVAFLVRRSLLLALVIAASVTALLRFA